MYKIWSGAILFFLVLFLLTGIVAAEDDLFTKVDEYNNLRLGNDYIVLVVNQQTSAVGRFAIETTGGAPLRTNDDNKPLVYGRPNPWTSYSTIWIDGENFVFGGKTERRAGKNGQYGELITLPEVSNNRIITRTKFNDITVEQILSIVKSSTTGLYDSAQIQYRIINNSDVEHKVGLRTMLDTMLGENDGAPFRLGADAVTEDKLYYKKQLSSFWQAFDSLAAPQVTSQGTFIGNDVTPPDKVYFSDWGSLADGVWDFDFNPGQNFIRKGEYEIDSAIAMYWVPEIIKPGEVKTYITKYGLGGITIVPGLLSLGVSSPAEVTINKSKQSFPIVGYLENTSEINAKDVKVTLQLPDSFAANNPIRELGNMEPGDIAQINWEVRPVNAKIPSDITYRVIVEAANTDNNQVERSVSFVGPPELNAVISLVDEVKSKLGQLQPNPFRIQAQISNTGESTLYGVGADLSLPPGLVTGPKEVTLKHLGSLAPGEKVNVNWLVKALKIEGEQPFAVNVSGINDYNTTSIEKMKLPSLIPMIYLQKKTGNKSDDYMSLNINAANLGEVEQLDFVIKYNQDQLDLSYSSRGNLFIKDNKLLPYNGPVATGNGIIKFSEKLPFNKGTGTLTTIHFREIEDDYELSIDNIKCFDEMGNEIKIKIQELN